MSIMQFGNLYIDPVEIIAIDTDPLSGTGHKYKGDYYHVYIRGIKNSLGLQDEAARKCLAAFRDRNCKL